MLVAVIASLLMTLALSATASARSIAADTTFGLRDYFKPERKVIECTVLNDGKLAIAGSFSPGFTSASRWGTKNRVATTIIRDTNKQSSRTRIAWHRQYVPGWEPIATAFAGDGSFFHLSTTGKSRRDGTFALRKSKRDGRADRGFGVRGTVKLRTSGGEEVPTLHNPKLLGLREGGVIIASQRSTELTLTKFGKDGKLADWGTNGTVRLAALEPLFSLPPLMRMPLVETIDEGLLATVMRNGKHQLVKLGANGQVDTSFGTGGYWLPPASPENVPEGSPMDTVIAGVSVHSSTVAVLYGIQAQLEVGISTAFHAAIIHGVHKTEWYSPKLGQHYNGGDTGFPSENPFVFRLTDGGVVFAKAETYYPSAVVRTDIARWTPAGIELLYSRSQETLPKGVAVARFAVGGGGTQLLGCGSLGTVNTGKPKVKRLKHIAVRRIGF